ncbi:MAG: thioesterase family protein, partial [Saezia sp.]
MELKVGNSMTVETLVSEKNVAAKYLEGLPHVFATPDMIGEMESASYLCLQQSLEAGKASVGTHVNVSHNMAVPMGQTIKTTATIEEIDRKKVIFKVQSLTEKGEVVGQGTHKRFI